MMDVIDVVGHSIEGLAGWRYLLSPSYRRRTHLRWQSQSTVATGMEIITFVGSFFFVTVIIAAIAWSLL